MSRTATSRIRASRARTRSRPRAHDHDVVAVLQLVSAPHPPRSEVPRSGASAPSLRMERLPPDRRSRRHRRAAPTRIGRTRSARRSPRRRAGASVERPTRGSQRSAPRPLPGPRGVSQDGVIAFEAHARHVWPDEREPGIQMRRVGDRHLGRRDRSQGVQDAPPRPDRRARRPNPWEILATVAPGDGQRQHGPRTSTLARAVTSTVATVADRRPPLGVVAVRGRDRRTPPRTPHRSATPGGAASVSRPPRTPLASRVVEGGEVDRARRVAAAEPDLRTGALPPPIRGHPRQTDDGAGRRAARAEVTRPTQRSPSITDAPSGGSGRRRRRSRPAVPGPGLPQVAGARSPRKSALSSFIRRDRPRGDQSSASVSWPTRMCCFSTEGYAAPQGRTADPGTGRPASRVASHRCSPNAEGK